MIVITCIPLHSSGRAGVLPGVELPRAAGSTPLRITSVAGLCSVYKGWRKCGKETL